MKLNLLMAAILASVTSTQALALNPTHSHQQSHHNSAQVAQQNSIIRKVSDELSLRAAIEAANADSGITKIVFAHNSSIFLTQPVIYSGSQPLTLSGKNSTIDGSRAGNFIINEDLTATTEDASLIFNTAANITIKKLTIDNSATRGIAINIPSDATGDNISVTLNHVSITNSALFGLHIDDNSDEFDDGISGSSIGINLNMNHSSVTGNGVGAIDFDGVRVDERAEGDIVAVIRHSIINNNGGDGMELDEAGAGDVDAILMHTQLNNNGFYNAEDLDDGLDIDEANDGNINVNLIHVQASYNMDEGIDLDEMGQGDVDVNGRFVEANHNFDEGFKVDEEQAGNIHLHIKHSNISNNGDDGMQLTEQGHGYVQAKISHSQANENSKYGVKVSQWFIEDEDVTTEIAGQIIRKNLTLNGNIKGDNIDTDNVTVIERNR